MLAGLVAEIRGHARRLVAEQESRDELAGTGVPMLTLPRLPEGVQLGEVYQLADLLTDAGSGRMTAALDLGADPAQSGHQGLGHLRLRRRRQDHDSGGDGGAGCGRGPKVAVLTIDPARRLAQSLGLGELDNTPAAWSTWTPPASCGR